MRPTPLHERASAKRDAHARAGVARKKLTCERVSGAGCQRGPFRAHRLDGFVEIPHRFPEPHPQNEECHQPLSAFVSQTPSEGREGNSPMINAKTPIHALSLCTAGFSNVSRARPTILCLNEMRLNVRKKTNDRPSATATKPGTIGNGSERRSVGTDDGRAVVSGNV
jgi:hypothetical protein